MNTYDTSGEPLGSTSVKVLYNNASNLDDAMNGTPEYWVDRFGRNRVSLSGFEAEFERRLDALGYYGLDNVYAAGLVLDSRAEIFLKDGEYYRLGPSAAIPYTLVGNWSVDGPDMVAVGDASLRSQLASSTGTDVVGFQGQSLTQRLGAVITPEMYGAPGTIGTGNAVADTAAWSALAVDAVKGVRVRADRTYLINGAINFPNPTGVVMDLRAGEWRQQQTFKQTMQFMAPSGLVFFGGTFYGLGGSAGEYDGASSSYNGVAAIYVEGGTDVFIDGLHGRQHAGGCIVFKGTIKKTVQNVDIQGIGSTYIDPVGQGNQGNGSDFGIMCQPLDNTLGWVYEDTFNNCRIYDHAFGIQTVQTKVCRVNGGVIGPCWGQHGIYAIENDNFSIVGTHFTQCYQFAVKNQFENYAGRFIGDVWAPDTTYAVGAVRRYSSILWRCVVGHTAGSTFVSSNWVVDDRYRRKGLSFTSFTIDGCGYGIGIINTSTSNPYDEYNRAGQIKDVLITNTVNTALYLERMVDMSLADVTVDTCSRGLFGTALSGSIKNLTVRNSALSAVAVSVHDNLDIEGSDFINCGAAGAGEDQKAGVVTFALGSSGLPSAAAHPTIYFDNNKWPIDTVGLYLVFDADTASRLNWEISNTGGVATTKKFYIQGTVTKQFRNHFSVNGYANTAQNEPTFNLSNWTTNFNFDANGAVTDQADVIATLMSILGGKNVIRKTG